MVKLTTSSKVSDIELEKAHAERLLKMANNGGWKIHKDSPYILKDGIITKSDKRTSKKASK